MLHKQQRRCELCALSVVVVFYLSKRKIVLASRDEAATVDIKKVVRGSGQMRGLLGLAESKSTAGWGAGSWSREVKMPAGWRVFLFFLASFFLMYYNENTLKSKMRV